MSFDYESYERDLKYNNVGTDYGEVLTSESNYPINLTYGLTMEEYGTITRLEEHLSFNGRTTKEFDMYLIERDAPTPEEFEQHITVPYRQGYIDFSHRNGERVYHGRTLTYVFQIFSVSKEERKVREFNITNWLMNSGETQLVDSHDFDYYYNGKCKSVSVEDDEMNQTMIFTIVFIAQPFKISKRYEGHDIWDDINFELDYFQEHQITLKSFTAYSDETFIPLEIGDRVHIGAWSQYIGDSQTPEDVLSVAYPIEDIRNAGMTSDTLRSTKQYLLGVLNVWVYEQDIIEAIPPQEITLYNTGVHKVLPHVSVIWSTSPFANISVVLDEKVHHIKTSEEVLTTRDAYNKTLFLKPGENKLKVYGYGWKVDFQWRREVL